MEYNFSYNVLIDRFNAFADGHYLIKRFTHGQIDLADLGNDEQYPFMHVTPDSIQPANGSCTFGFHVMFADIPRDKETKAEYQREVISDCVRLAQDLIGEIKNGLTLFGYEVQMANEPLLEPFMEEYKNTLTGIAFTIQLQVPYDWSACDIPANWSVGGGSGGGGGGTAVGITFRVNGVDNAVQNILDLVEGSGITIVDNGNGSVTFTSDGGGGGEFVSTEYNANHTTATGNQYLVGDRVWYNGNVYRCIANNDALLPTNTTYWTLVDVGYRLRQSPVDYNATSGDYQILNKPTIPTELRDLSDVSIVTPIQNDTLIFDALSNQFTNGQLADVAYSNDYNDLSNLPSIPAAQVNSDWSAVGGVAQILNKPTIPTTLDSLTDVNTPAPSNAQVLTWNTATSQWIASTPSGGGGSGTVTSVALTTPAAFNVTGSPITTAGTLAITGAGTSAQYVDGTGALQTFPTLPLVIGDMLKSVYDTDADGVVDSAERIEIVVRNSTGITLTKGQVVYLSGATGNRPNAVLADASIEATSSKTIGIITANIANNSDGFVAVNGTLHDLDTSAFAAGDLLWLSETPGAMQANTPPAEPAHAVFIGYVARAHPTQGRIVLAIQNGFELSELHGVQITGEAANDLLMYDAPTTLWKNKTLADLKSLLGLALVGGRAVLATDFTTVGVAFQNVTGLSFPVTAGKTYKWRATILIIANVTTNGTLSTFGPAGTTTYRFTGGLGVSTNNINNGNSNNQTNNQAISLSLRMATADGIYSASATGTVGISVISTVAAAITLKAGSIIEYDEVL